MEETSCSRLFGSLVLDAKYVRAGKIAGERSLAVFDLDQVKAVNMASKKYKEPKSNSELNALSEAMRNLGEKPLLEARRETQATLLKARKRREANGKRKIEEVKIEVIEMIQSAYEDTIRQIMTGEFQDPHRWEYGDGDQTPLPSPEESTESQKLRYLLGKKVLAIRIQANAHYVFYYLITMHIYFSNGWRLLLGITTHVSMDEGLLSWQT